MSAYRRARAPAAAALAAGLVALLLGALWPPGTAHAAAQPRKVSSDPAAGETRHHAPDRVRITFDEPLDASSEIKVTDRCDRRLDDGNTRVNLNEMSVGIARKPSGTYHVSYKATGVGGATGTRFASFRFEVHMGPPCDGGPAEHRHATGDGERPGHEHRPGNGGHSGAHRNRHRGDHRRQEHAAGPHRRSHARDHLADHRDADHDDPGHEARGHRRHAHDETEAGLDDERDLGDLALGEGEPAADGGAVLIGLALAMALGILGGLILRLAPN